MYSIWAKQAEEDDVRLWGVFDEDHKASASFGHMLQMAIQHDEFDVIKLIVGKEFDGVLLAIYDYRGVAY